MRKWYVIDDSTKASALVTETPLKATTKEEALVEGRMRWSYLTKRERSQVDDFFICTAEEDEDGAIDWNSMEDVYSFKTKEE